MDEPNTVFLKIEWVLVGILFHDPTPFTLDIFTMFTGPVFHLPITILLIFNVY